MMDGMGTSASQRLREARQAFANGDHEGARGLVTEVRSEFEGAEPSRHADLAHLLASYHRDVGLGPECEAFAREAISLERQVGRRALLGNHLMFLADFLCKQGRLAEALPLAEEGLSCYVDTCGPNHSETKYMTTVVAAIAKRLRQSENGNA
jgi:hypothetical protein